MLAITSLFKQLKPFIIGLIDGKLAQGGGDLGSPLSPFSHIYTTYIAGILTGSEWEVAGSPVIDANVPGGVGTVYVTNQGAGATGADLDVQRNISLGGTINGMDIEDHRSRHLLGGSDPTIFAQNTEPSGTPGLMWIDTNEVV